MYRFQPKDKFTIVDTETNDEFVLMNLTTKAIASSASDICDGLNINLARKLRRDSKVLSYLEFEAIRGAFALVKANNTLVNDVRRLCDLITSHLDSINFAK